ncbi:MAG: hypothetical protein Q9201_006958 [Fulgogasparrea decipioides]
MEGKRLGLEIAEASSAKTLWRSSRRHYELVTERTDAARSKKYSEDFYKFKNDFEQVRALGDMSIKATNLPFEMTMGGHIHRITELDAVNADAAYQKEYDADLTKSDIIPDDKRNPSREYMRWLLSDIVRLVYHDDDALDRHPGTIEERLKRGVDASEAAKKLQARVKNLRFIPDTIGKGHKAEAEPKNTVCGPEEPPKFSDFQAQQAQATRVQKNGQTKLPRAYQRGEEPIQGATLDVYGSPAAKEDVDKFNDKLNVAVVHAVNER